MGDRFIITDDEPKPEPAVIVVKERETPKVEKVVTEKTIVVEEKRIS
jgi:hypothetical protein